MIGALGAQLFQLLIAALNVGEQALGEGAVLNIGQDVPHALLCARINQAGARQVATELGGVRDRIVHVRNTAFEHEVDNEFHFVQAFEVGHLRLVASLGEHFETNLNELLNATAQHSLLAEQVGHGLRFESGGDHAGAGATDSGSVRQAQVLALTLGVLLHSDEAGNTLAVHELTTHQVARTLGGNHAHGDIGGRFDQVEVNVEAVAEQ